MLIAVHSDFCEAGSVTISQKKLTAVGNPQEGKGCWGTFPTNGSCMKIRNAQNSSGYYAVPPFSQLLTAASRVGLQSGAW